MGFSGSTYIAGETPVHRCDARVKVLVLLAFSIGIFFVRSWWAMGVLGLLVCVVLAAARVPFAQVNRMLAPVYALAAFSLLFNVVATPTPEGALTGLFFAVRMVVLVAASFAVCLTTPPSALIGAFRWFIGPLRHLRVPVDDIAFTLALSLRFIPVIEREFATVRAAQKSRGAELSGLFTRKVRIWGVAFAAMFVGLFRHANALATAMDARCYGMPRDLRNETNRDPA